MEFEKIKSEEELALESLENEKQNKVNSIEEKYGQISKQYDEQILLLGQQLRVLQESDGNQDEQNKILKEMDGIRKQIVENLKVRDDELREIYAHYNFRIQQMKKGK